MGKFRWSNIPIPEGHMITLVAGIALLVWRPLEFWQAVLQRQISAWTLLMMGILLALWGTVMFKDMDFEKPTAIITAGPYAFSRNPMYVAWTLIYLAFVLLVNTWWLIILPPMLLFSSCAPGGAATGREISRLLADVDDGVERRNAADL